MVEKHGFLGVLLSLFFCLFSTNVFAATKCSANWYLDEDGSTCLRCIDLGGPWTNSTSVGGKNTSPQSCYKLETTDCIRQECPEAADGACEYSQTKIACGIYYPETKKCEILNNDKAYCPMTAKGHICNPFCRPVITTIKLIRNYDDTDNTLVATKYQSFGEGWCSDEDADTCHEEPLVGVTMSRDDYEFIGFNTMRDGTGQTLVFSDLTYNYKTVLSEEDGATIELYAKWRRMGIECPAGQKLNAAGTECEICAAGEICPGPNPDNPDDPNVPTTCAKETKGLFPNSDPGNDSINGCYRDCELAINAMIMTGHDYYNGMSSCHVKYCMPGYMLNRWHCVLCAGGHFCPIPDCPDCPNPGPQSCKESTNGEYPKADQGSSSIDDCYRDCPATSEGVTMSGRDYHDAKRSTCEIDGCPAGQKLNADGTTCELCTEGEFCPGTNPIPDPDCPDCLTPTPGPQSCNSLGDGSWPYSDKGAVKASDCYEKCETHDVEGGIAIKKTDRSYYNKRCEYEGYDNDNNPCDIVIVDKKEMCIEKACKSSYEMIDGKCTPCNREHALSYMSTGNCIVEACDSGWHPFTTRCEPDVLDCSIPNATRAQAVWDYAKNAYTVCTVVECADGFHLTLNNACVADVQTCTVEHGIGEKEWNHQTRMWGECHATACEPGYTNDLTESNEPTKQCGNCRNKFGINGEVAAQVYSTGCNISACMYQGERYALENNECVPICKDAHDETGTKVWNPATKKCVRTCNPGYVSW